MDFVEAWEKAKKSGLNLSDREFKEIWQESENRKQKEEEWKRKTTERQWLQQETMPALRMDQDGTTTVRNRPLNQAPKVNRSGAIFVGDEILNSDQLNEELNKHAQNIQESLSTTSLNVSDERQRQQQRRQQQQQQQEQLLQTRHEIEEMKFPPTYTEHHKYHPVKSSASSSSQTEVKQFECDDGDRDNLFTPLANTITTKAHCDTCDADDDDINMTSEQKSELLEIIKKLSEEQKTLQQRLNEHDQRLSSLVKKQPSIQRRLTTKGYKLMTTSQTTGFGYQGKGQAHMISETVIQEEEKIYAQIEQLYANFCRINFPFKFVNHVRSKAESGIYHELDGIYSDTSTSVTQENEELRLKVNSLEECLRQYQGQTCVKTPLVENERDMSIISLRPGAQMAQCQRDQRDQRDALPPPSPKVVHHKKDLEQIGFTFEWTIGEYSEKLSMERTGKRDHTISDVFEIGRHGYRGCFEIYLNGNGTGCDKCLSFFLRIVKGDYDEHLVWPAVFSLKFILVNQQDEKCSESLIYGKEDKAFVYKRPSGNSDKESDAWGLVEFVSHQMMSTKKYIKDDVIKVQMRISKK